MSDSVCDLLQDLSISCSWGVLNERKIEDALTVETSEVSSKIDRLEHTVSLETCVHLGASTPVPCLLEIKLKNPKLKISEICVVSEARIIEIYGKCGEYLITSHAEFLDECEDMIVYVSEYKFPQPSPECSLLFARMKTKGQMWLYGVHISAVEDVCLSKSSVNFNNVNKILKESSLQLTDKADKCKKFLQLYSSYLGTNNSQTLPNPQTILKMFDSVYISQSSATSQSKGVGKCLSDLLPGIGTFNWSRSDNVENCCNAPQERRLKSKDSDEFTKFVVEELKQHLDRQFQGLAVSLFSVVDKKLIELEDKQNKKLDDIILHIDKKFNDLSAKLFSNFNQRLNDFEEKQNQKLNDLKDLVLSIKQK